MQNKLVFALTLMLSSSGLAACELLVDFDRTKIPVDATGDATTPLPDATLPVEDAGVDDASDDAAPATDASDDAAAPNDAGGDAAQPVDAGEDAAQPSDAGEEDAAVDAEPPP